MIKRAIILLILSLNSSFAFGDEITVGLNKDGNRWSYSTLPMNTTTVDGITIERRILCNNPGTYTSYEAFDFYVRVAYTLEGETTYHTPDFTLSYVVVSSSLVRVVLTYEMPPLPDSSSCTCDACCSCECSCGNNTTSCNGQEGSGGCFCHGCTCGACCSCNCTCGNNTTSCTGQTGAGGCFCHVCTCDACCKCKCTCGGLTTTCTGAAGAGGCSCHACTCGACCSCECSCGKLTTPCSGESGEGGCSCHKENECTCGACCACKCTCGKWSGIGCSASCAHKCVGDGCGCKLGYSQHCECHHKDEDGEGDCCEHHKKDFKGKDHQLPNDPGNPAVFNFTPPTPGTPNFSNPGQGIFVPQPSTPKGVKPSFDGPGDVEEKELEFFERPEEAFGFPKLKYEDIFDRLKEKLGEKLPLDWIDTLKNGGGDSSGINLVWKFEIDYGGFKIGPRDFDLKEYIGNFAEMQIVQILRLVLLFLVVILLIIAILGVIFSASKA